MRRILIVDDSRAIRQLLAQALAAHGYSAIEAETGEDALFIAVPDPPDAIVVDYHLPGLSGAELIRTIRAASDAVLREVPIVGLSGRQGSERILLDAGASCFIPKPFREVELIKAVRWALDVYGTVAVP